MGDLREWLIDAKIAGSKTLLGYEFRTNEHAADVAIHVLATWLREQAKLELGVPERTNFSSRRYERSRVLTDLADALIPDPEKQERS